MNQPTIAEIDVARTMEFWRFILFDLCLGQYASLRGGPRTLKRNRQVDGHEHSRHMWEYGHGMAADLWFNHQRYRDIAVERIAEHGYHSFIGPDYNERQLHVQAVPPGTVLTKYGEAARIIG